MADKFTRGGAVYAGSTGVSLPIVLRKTADSTEMTGKVAADVTASYWRQGGSRTAITVADLALITTAWTSGGWKEVDATNQPGAYRFDVPDEAFVVGADWVVVTVKVGSCFVWYLMIPISSLVSFVGGPGTDEQALASVPVINVSGFVSLAAEHSPVLHTGSAQGGSADTITLKAAASGITDIYVGCDVKLYNAEETRTIIAYNSTTKIATVDRVWKTVPVEGTKYAVLATNSPRLDAALGVSLSATGLDAIAIPEPTTVPTTFPGWFMWLIRRFAPKGPSGKATMPKSGNGNLIVYASDGTTVITTQAVTDDGITQTLNKVS